MTAKLTKSQIREIFLANGFTVKEGEKDLRQYVYDAANALLKAQASTQTRSLQDAKNLPEEERRILKYYFEKEAKALSEAAHASSMIEQLLGKPSSKPVLKKPQRRTYVDTTSPVTAERLASSPTYWFRKMEAEERSMVTASGRKYQFVKEGYESIDKVPGRSQFKSIAQTSLQYDGAAVLAVFEHFPVVQITKNGVHFCYLVYEQPDLFTIQPAPNNQHVSL